MRPAHVLSAGCDRWVCDRWMEMKLNIGCGYNYLKGYVNIDSSEESLADRRMEAHSLYFEDCSIEEIKAAQLIEHLGFFKAQYFLTECYRVLKPGGLLVVETPNIEKTFKIFLKGDRGVRETALGWVYGSESLGMEHRYCFPAELLEEALAGAGFKLVKKDLFDYQVNRPALRFSARKNGSAAADLAAALRRELSVRGALYLGDEYAAAEMEKLLKIALAQGVSADEDAVFELALYEPRLAEAFFRVKGTARFMKASAGLAAGNFTARMYGTLARQPLGITQKDAFAAALEEGRRDLKEALVGRLPPLEKIGPHALFSLEMARIVSDRTFRAGLKAYANDAFGEAAGSFAEALRLCRDNPYAWLYFARSFEARGEYNECGAAYERALAVFESVGLAGPETIGAVKEEIETFRHRGGASS